ncbi:EamA family transporter [Paraburkholderia sediminicola]|uniref:EamA family transporter n=1 Tax=Paraburkholderia sediminicola TaxID=458836 RepID=UPI0038BA1C4A
MTVMAAVLFAGPIIPPAIVAMVPVVLAIVGNLGEKTVRWRMLSIPLGLLTLGLVLVNLSGLAEALGGMSIRVVVGIAISVGAVLLWTVFALTNRTALAARPTMDARMWTAMMMIGGAVEIMVFMPLAASTGLLNLTKIGIRWHDFAPVLLGSFILAVIGSIAGSWAWTIAAKRIPVGLAGQLIVTETVFATFFGLIATHRWPTWPEALGVISIVCGVVSALKVLQTPSSFKQVSAKEAVDMHAPASQAKSPH